MWKRRPEVGEAKRIATGFGGATNLAIAPGGKIYVAELFAGKISTIKDGKPHTWMSLPNAVSVEYGDGHLYAGTMAPLDADFNRPGPAAWCG